MSTKQIITAMLTASLALAGCQTIDPYTGEQKTSQTTRGALIGAAAGVVAGLITGDDSMERKKRALIAGGVGALAGGAVGAYQDRQEARLRAELEGTGVSVTRFGDNITLNMPGNVTFAYDSADLNPAFFPVLTSVGKVLREFDRTVVEIAGHTDSTGTGDYNLGLSQRRAGTVAQYLASQGVEDNGTAQGRQFNRRVEITTVPITQ
jgi:outer membrane protein OmpA-like peptidoglycan-associated protein